MTNREARHLIQKIKSHIADLFYCIYAIYVELKIASENVKEHHIADLNDVSSFVWFWQSTHNHVRVSDRLNLATMTQFSLSSRRQKLCVKYYFCKGGTS